MSHSHAIKNVIIAGGTGTVGEPILKALLADGSFHVSVLTREGSKATFPTDAKVHKSNYSPESLEAAFKGQDAVISTITSTAVPEQKRLIDAAVKAGVKRFIPSEFGANLSDPEFAKRLSVFEQKVEIVEYLRQKERNGLAWSAILTGTFYDWALQVGFLGIDLKEQTALLIDQGTRKLRTTTLPSIGRAVVGVLKHPGPTANKYISVASFEASQQQILKAVEKATGKTFKVQQITSDELYKIGSEKVSKGDWSGVFDQLKGTVVAGLDKQNPLDNAKIGLANEDLDDVTAKVLSGKYT